MPPPGSARSRHDNLGRGGSVGIPATSPDDAQMLVVRLVTEGR